MKGLRYLFILIVFHGYGGWLSGQPPVEYFFADQMVCENDTLRLPLQARDFINVRNFQSSVRWNPDELTFQALEEIHPQLASNFLINTDSIESGGFGYFWLDNTSGEPLVLANNSVLFVLKFTIADGVESTTVSFGEVPTLTETVVENNGAPMQVTSTQISGLISKNRITADALIQDAGTGSNGEINLTVLTGQPPFTFFWNTGATTEDLDNLVSDNYSVTITDAQGCTANFGYLVDINTATQNEASSAWTIGPNPTYDYLNIQSVSNQLNGIYQYEIYDLQGNVIFKKNNVESDLIEKIDLQTQSSGLYFLQIKINKNIQLFKLVKK